MSADRAEWSAYTQGGNAYVRGFQEAYTRISNQPRTRYTRCWLMGWNDAKLIAETKEKAHVHTS